MIVAPSLVMEAADIRLPANDALQRDIEPLLIRPVGRPSNTPTVWYAGFCIRPRVGIRPVA